MSTVFSVLVGAGFLWSVVLFFSAVFMDAREQEAGFGWALLGAALYFVTFADQLPGSPMGLRGVFEFLPGVTSSDADFQSPFLVLVVLLVAYAIRLLVFYQLVLDLNVGDFDGDGRVDDLNDLVAPFLSFVCFAICAVTALWGLYSLGPVATLLVALATVALYCSPRFFRFLRPYLRVAYEFLRSYGVVIVQELRNIVMLLIIGIVRLELTLRGRDPSSLDKRIDERRKAIEAKRQENQTRRREALAGLLNRTAASTWRRPKPPPPDTPRNPNMR